MARPAFVGRLAEGRFALLVAALGLLSGCASTGRPPAFDLEPEEWDRAVRALGLDPASVVCPVRATPAMAQAAQVLGGRGEDAERVERLHAALQDRGAFAFENESSVTFTAAEAFAAKRGNCVSFANLLIALARAVGVPLQAGLILSSTGARTEGDLIVTYTHMVAVLRTSRGFRTWDFYTDRSRRDLPGELRLIDDLDVAAVALSNRGVAALEEGDLPAARALLEKAIRLGPSLPDLHANLGTVYLREGDVDRALATFLRGLDVDPHRAALLHNLAGLYLEIGCVAEARAALEAADPSQSSAHLLVVKGDLEYAEGNRKRALRSYREARSRDPGLLSPLLRIARTELALGKPARARKALEEARRLSPDDEQVREMLRSQARAEILD